MIKPEQITGTDEKAEQIRLFCWAANNRDRYPQLKWLHAIPNANSHRQVAEGCRAGVSDVCLPYPVQNKLNWVWWHGLYIEMKLEKRRNQKNGGLSDEQIDFLNYAKSVGYCAEVCYGWEAAVKVIEEYLNG